MSTLPLPHLVVPAAALVSDTQQIPSMLCAGNQGVVISLMIAVEVNLMVKAKGVVIGSSLARETGLSLLLLVQVEVGHYMSKGRLRPDVVGFKEDTKLLDV
nr:hypothetical transcript [Hymenolepis microstoma]